jgi:hypothetical protein
MANPVDEFAASVASPESRKATYTATHAPVKSGDVTLQGVRRDSDGVPFVAITRRSASGDERTRYDRADRVALYLQLLARKGEQ